MSCRAYCCRTGLRSAPALPPPSGPAVVASAGAGEGARRGKSPWAVSAFPPLPCARSIFFARNTRARNAAGGRDEAIKVTCCLAWALRRDHPRPTLDAILALPTAAISPAGFRASTRALAWTLPGGGGAKGGADTAGGALGLFPAGTGGRIILRNLRMRFPHARAQDHDNGQRSQHRCYCTPTKNEPWAPTPLRQPASGFGNRALPQAERRRQPLGIPHSG